MVSRAARVWRRAVLSRVRLVRTVWMCAVGAVVVMMV